MKSNFKPSFTIHFLISLVVFLFNLQAQPRPTGFASVSGNGVTTTTGGYGGETVTVTNQSDLEKYAGSSGKVVILVKGTIKITPKGKEITVTSNKTIQGVDSKSTISEGGFNLNNVSNIIIRNLTIRDSYIEGDWIGRVRDDDGIQMDNCHHIWIDHCHLTRMADGLIDSRKNTTFLTVSWCKLSHHNKAFGIGWTPDVTAQITLHHTWFDSVSQRNPSADNVQRMHMYNNLLTRVMTYGNFSRGGTNSIIENTVYKNVPHPHFVELAQVTPTKSTGTLKVSGCSYTACTGQQVMEKGTPYFDPKDFYKYTLTPTDQVESLLRSCAGPQDDLDKCEDASVSVTENRIKHISQSIITSEANRYLSMFFPDQSPVAVSVYSLDGKLHYNQTANITSNHRWRAPRTGLYHLIFTFRDGQAHTATQLVVD